MSFICSILYWIPLLVVYTRSRYWQTNGAFIPLTAHNGNLMLIRRKFRKLSKSEALGVTSSTSLDATTIPSSERSMEEEEVDVAIVGAGIGGLCAGAILNTLYGKKVGIYESHYLPGGCAHAFDRTVKIPNKGGKDEKVTFTFDSGPTIVLGCSSKPYNPLRQVLNVIGLGDDIEWIPYDKWGMIENPGKPDKEIRWKVELGPEIFEKGPLTEFGDVGVLEEFQELRKATKGLVSGAVEIPAMAMRSGKSALLPLLRYFPALIGLIQQGAELTQGTFAPFMDGPNFVVKDKWLRNWLDALAFSLSGLPASRTAAAAMAYVLYDMHREGATLDYPKGGLGKIIDALVKGVEQGSNNSKVNLRSHVESIMTSEDGSRVIGLQLRSGKIIKAKDGIICNTPVWSLNGLIHNDLAKRRLNNLIEPKALQPRQSWKVPSDHSEQRSTINSETRPQTKSSSSNDESSLLEKCDTSEMTGSFIHLHLALDATGLDLDSMEAHYTVMDRGLSGNVSRQSNDDSKIEVDGPCGELNMIALSNPCVLDRTLAPEGYIVVHAYGAGNEPYDIWKDMRRDSPEYQKLKEERSDVLWRAVESIIPDVRKRVVTDMVGSPITHERFLRRPRGTYGSATEDYLKDGSTPLKGLVLAGDGVFPGIGVPAVALSGASAANSLVDPLKQWNCLDKLERSGLL